MSGVEFGLLPERGWTGYEDVVAELKARPGEWAKVKRATNLHSSDAYRRRDRLIRLGCDAEVRMADRSAKSGRRDVWARWPA